MKRIKSRLLFFLFLGVAAILFRGGIYRNLVIYKSVGESAPYSVTSPELAAHIRENAKGLSAPGIRQVIDAGLSITRKRLHFTAEKNENDPNRLLGTRSAHCVGYAHFFASTCNFLLEQHGLAELWVARPQVGQLYVFGTNVHPYFSSPFFKDHDFVSIENKKTGEVFAVDPAVSDYLRVDFVSYGK